MTNSIICPVPIHQIPMVEFHKLTSSWFFSWPMDSKKLYSNLIASWIVITPINIIIGTGSIVLSNNVSKLIFLGLSTGLILPMILLSQLLIGWNYILKRNLMPLE